MSRPHDNCALTRVRIVAAKHAITVARGSVTVTECDLEYSVRAGLLSTDHTQRILPEQFNHSRRLEPDRRQRQLRLLGRR